MGDDTNSTKHDKRSRKALVTHTSILILSSFIVGVAVQKILPPDQVLLVLAAGAVGMLSYLGLDYVSRNRAERAVIEEEERSVERLEGRLNKHVPPSIQPTTVVPSNPKPKVDWQTLVAVAEKSRE